MSLHWLLQLVLLLYHRAKAALRSVPLIYNVPILLTLRATFELAVPVTLRASFRSCHPLWLAGQSLGLAISSLFLPWHLASRMPQCHLIFLLNSSLFSFLFTYGWQWHLLWGSSSFSSFYFGPSSFLHFSTPGIRSSGLPLQSLSLPSVLQSLAFSLASALGSSTFADDYSCLKHKLSSISSSTIFHRYHLLRFSIVNRISFYMSPSLRH